MKTHIRSAGASIFGEQLELEGDHWGWKSYGVRFDVCLVSVGCNRVDWNRLGGDHMGCNQLLGIIWVVIWYWWGGFWNSFV